MKFPALTPILLLWLPVIAGGCRMGAPIHVWDPPQLESTVGKRVALSGVSGPAEVVGPLQQQLLDQAPSDPGRQMTLVGAGELQRGSEIQLVSAVDDLPSDLAAASVARRRGMDYVLSGEVVPGRNRSRSGPSDSMLTVSWRLTALNEEHAGGGMPLVVDVNTAVDRYPDLALVGDPLEILNLAMARDTYHLITPWVSRDRVQLEIPYLLPGSADVRRGNLAARGGRWGEAEAIWSQVHERHPTQIAALHNLALAAAAGQDFSRAKKLARKAIRLQPSKLHKRTMVWIEVKQRAYHEAFGLEDPPEGWFVTEAPAIADRADPHETASGSESAAHQP